MTDDTNIISNTSKFANMILRATTDKVYELFKVLIELKVRHASSGDVMPI